MTPDCGLIGKEANREDRGMNALRLLKNSSLCVFMKIILKRGKLYQISPPQILNVLL